jgi:hypothetical protein
MLPPPPRKTWSWQRRDRLFGKVAIVKDAARSADLGDPFDRKLRTRFVISPH